jgi:eukaryotic-like serine/threonine-protein kinase
MSGERADAATPSGQVMVGDVIDATYRIDETLGRGGMGAVFGATDLKRGRRVAIKTLLSAGGDRELTERLVREARTSVIPASDHVAKVFEVGALPSGAPFLILERLDGETLDAYVRRESPLPIEVAVDLVIQACVGLAAAHGAGIVHRDVKPSNLFLAESSTGTTLKILDFGISKFREVSAKTEQLTTLTGTGATLGSPQYMSPEQLRSSRDVDARADMFSLGIVLHRALTNRLPFDADGAAGYVAQIVSEDPIPAREQRGDVPEGLEQVILRCLEKRPVNRYANIAELAGALAPFASPGGRAAAAKAAAFAPALEAVARRARDELGESTTVTYRNAGGRAQAMTRSIPAETSSFTRRQTAAGISIAAAAAGAALALVIVMARRAPEASPEPPAIASAPAPVVSLDPSAAVVAAPSPTAAARVKIEVVVDAPGATLEVDGARTGSPLDLERSEAPHTLVVAAPGREPETREIVADRDRRLELTLRRARAPATSTEPHRARTPRLMEKSL